MIISRTPFRISLGGGGTDLPSYYGQWGGFLMSAAINRYMYVMVNKRFDHSIRVSYSKTEIAQTVAEVQHPIVRESLKYLGVESGIEVVSIADLPAESGLGSSGSFTVGLLNALHAFKGEWKSPQELAEEAFTIEAEILGEPVGKQDQYIAAFGGVLSLSIETNGAVTANKHLLDDDTLDRLESNIVHFYTGIQRRSSEILRSQSKSAENNEGKVLESMHKIKEIGLECAKRLQAGDVDWFGESLDIHWNLKKQISTKMADPTIDRWYETAKQNGALGGKIIGAGGGGFFMFYCPNGESRSRLRKAMAGEGLKEMRFRIEPEGSKTLLNMA